MNPTRPLTILYAAMICASPLMGSQDRDSQDFDRDVAPILAQRCLSCHSGPDPKASLDLSNRSRAFAGGESGKTIEPGELAKSLLWEQIQSDQMPPKKPLSSEEKEQVKNWIAKGAKWGTEKIDPFRFSTEHRAGLDWWSLQPLQTEEPPGGDSNSTARNPIDHFIDVRLKSVGLSRSSEADKRTLIRRLTFDLLGLPPTPDQINAFLIDTSEDAYERLVDRLLESPHYGERWARHWIDVVRFGESNGYEYDEPRDNAWPYRNWLIESFNEDLPYDKFVRRQIAGDVLRSGDFKTASAAGFLVAGPHNTTLPSNDKMRRVMAEDELEDLVGIVGQTFLGLTVNCARCHDHKFDPISQKEYYQFAATLNGVKHGVRPFQIALTSAQRGRVAKIEERLESLGNELEQIIKPIREKIVADRGLNNVSQSQSPIPYASWEFEDDFRDSQGRLDGTPKSGARLENGFLVLDGKDDYVETLPIPIEIKEKTLEAWVQLDQLEQRGGGVISIQHLDGSNFDAIVFGEREPRRWMAGSNGFVRTRSFQGEDEVDAAKQTVHLAIVYKKDGTIIGYRNGKAYGAEYRPMESFRYEAGKAQIVFGLRHSPVGGNRMLGGRIQRAQLFDRALTPDEIAASAYQSDRTFVADSLIRKSMTEEQLQRKDRIDAETNRLRSERTDLLSLEQQSLYTCISSKPGATRVLLRGDIGSPAEEVAPQGLGAIAGTDSDFGLTGESTDGERRTKLANWITHAKNPLFARVMVNRLWHYHFGQGLVSTPSDFGYNGGRPSHPDLLDWLASAFQKGGYRMKPIHRLMVNSATYRQASSNNAAAIELDADNRLHWRKSPVRLDAESIRDATLLIAGKLDTEVGGRGYRDVKHFFFKGSNFYETLEESGSELRRRTIYRFMPRGGRNPFLDTFDCPDPSSTTPNRAATTTPLQSLALMNNAFVFEMADSIAARAKVSTLNNSPDQTVSTIFLLIYGRTARPDEVELANQFIAQHGLGSYCRVLLNSNEFLYVR